MDVKKEIAALRLKANTLEFLDKIKSLGTRKDFYFKFSNSLSGPVISVETRGDFVKLPIADNCIYEFKDLLINFFEERLNKKEEPVKEVSISFSPFDPPTNGGAAC